MSERKGYIKDENGKWFCRVTFAGTKTGKAPNKKIICKFKSDAKVISYYLTNQITNFMIYAKKGRTEKINSSSALFSF
jgi:hypothetical protein